MIVSVRNRPQKMPCLKSSKQKMTRFRLWRLRMRVSERIRPQKEPSWKPWKWKMTALKGDNLQITTRFRL